MKEINLEELKDFMHQNAAAVLLDVRTAEERSEHNIGGIFIPLDEIMNRFREIPADVPVVVYCRKGVRSAIAIQRLSEKFGLTNLVNLKGGIGDR